MFRFLIILFFILSTQSSFSSELSCEQLIAESRANIKSSKSNVIAVDFSKKKDPTASNSTAEAVAVEEHYISPETQSFLEALEVFSRIALISPADINITQNQVWEIYEKWSMLVAKSQALAQISLPNDSIVLNRELKRVEDLFREVRFFESIVEMGYTLVPPHNVAIRNLVPNDVVENVNRAGILLKLAHQSILDIDLRAGEFAKGTRPVMAEKILHLVDIDSALTAILVSLNSVASTHHIDDFDWAQIYNQIRLTRSVFESPHFQFAIQVCQKDLLLKQQRLADSLRTHERALEALFSRILRDGKSGFQLVGHSQKLGDEKTSASQLITHLGDYSRSQISISELRREISPLLKSELFSMTNLSAEDARRLKLLITQIRKVLKDNYLRYSFMKGKSLFKGGEYEDAKEVSTLLFQLESQI